MRKSTVLFVLALATVAGCSGGGNSSANPSASSSPSPTSIAGVAVGGAFGSKPDVSLTTPLTVDQTKVDTLSKGDGGTVAKGDSVVVDYVGVVGRTGTQFDSSYDRGQPATVSTDNLIPGLAKAIDGQTVGSRVVAAVAPSDGYAPQGGIPGAGIGKNDTVVFVVDILAKPAFKPTGIPGVSLGEYNKQPLVDVAAPLTLDRTQVKALSQGKGATVKPGDSVTVNYVGVNGRTGSVFDSSYASGKPATFPTDGVVKGFGKALEGQPVGSRVVVAITSADGYGAAGNPQIGIQGGDPLVFYIDILATKPAPSTPPPASPPASPSTKPSPAPAPRPSASPS